LLELTHCGSLAKGFVIGVDTPTSGAFAGCLATFCI
jgi:hypothetical protein